MPGLAGEWLLGAGVPPTGAHGVTIRKFNYMGSPYAEAEDLATLVRLVVAGRLHPEIGRADDSSRTGEAIAALLEREVRGERPDTSSAAMTSWPPSADGPTAEAHLEAFYACLYS